MRALPAWGLGDFLRWVGDHSQPQPDGKWCLSRAELLEQWALVGLQAQSRMTALDVLDLPALHEVDAAYAACHLLPADWPFARRGRDQWDVCSDNPRPRWLLRFLLDAYCRGRVAVAE